MANRGGVNVPVSATWNGRALKQAESQLGSFKKSFGKAFLGIGAGVGAAVGIGALGSALSDMASAAAEDQKSVIALGKSMSNLGLGSQTTQAEAFVKQMMLMSGTADDALRPALQSILLATKDLSKAQSGLSLAMDISAATGKDLGSVSVALAKGYSGSATGLARLGVGLDKALLKSGDMVKITEVLTQKFGGQAQASAASYAGQLLRVQTAASEAGETIGYELLKSAESVATAFGGTGGITDSITAAGESLANFTAGIGSAVAAMAKFKMGGSDTALGLTDIAKALYNVLPQTGLLVKTYEGIASVGEDARASESALNDEINRSIQMRHTYTVASTGSAEVVNAESIAADNAAAAYDRLNRSLDKRNSMNRSILSAQISIRQAKAEGPGKNATADQRKQWAIGIAGQAAGLAQSFVDKGQLVKARNVLSSNRQFIAGQVGGRFASNVLGTPGSLNAAIDARRTAASAAGASEWRRSMQAGGLTASVTMNNVTIVANSDAELVKKATQAAKLKTLGRGLGDASNAAPAAPGAWGQIK